MDDEIFVGATSGEHYEITTNKSKYIRLLGGVWIEILGCGFSGLPTELELQLEKSFNEYGRYG